MTSSTTVANTQGNKFHSVYFCLSKPFVEYWKMVSLPIVLLVFITSNYPEKKLNEGLLGPLTTQLEKGFVDNGIIPKTSQAQVNDLTATRVKFPEDHSKDKVEGNKKIIREKVVPDEKDEKNKAPVPLYSLVKNECGEGYALDENGVCQKTITVRSGKNFGSEKRRKRHIFDYEWLTQDKEVYQNDIKDESRKISIECNRFYPGMVSDGNGGCKKSIKLSEQPLDKALPP